jgi:hypothetical protein
MNRANTIRAADGTELCQTPHHRSEDLGAERHTRHVGAWGGHARHGDFGL